jgi:dipeptidyl aminopeptidase/acylaminoacyl peptidase
MKKKYGIEDILKISQVYLPKVNHSKDKVAFYWDKTGRLELWVLNLKTRAIKQTSHGECPRAIRAGFLWTKDDKHLVFAKDRAGDENHNLFKLEIESGKVEQLTNTLEFKNYPSDISPDGRFIAMPSTRAGVLNLFRLDLKTKEVVQLTSHHNPVEEKCKWNPTKDLIAYTANETANLKNKDIWLTKPDGREQRRIISIEEGSIEGVAEWNTDGKLLAFTTDANGIEQAGVYNLETEEINLLGNRKHEECAAGFTDDSRKLVCLRNQEAKITPITYDLETNKCEILDFPTGVASEVQLALDDRYLITLLSTPTAPNHLVACEFDTHKLETLVAPQWGKVDSNSLVEPQYIKYKSSDGLEIPAILYKPKDVKKHPPLINPHGGPWWQFFLDFDMRAQVLVNEGYVVLQPNVRGSTGYGKEFRELNLMDWGGKDLEDVKAGAEFLKTLSWVDCEKIGIWGGSYGGYMTLMAVTKKPELWEAGCAWVGISHLKTFYDRSDPDFKYWFKMMMGDPEKNSEIWEDRSALNFAKNLRCPLLIIHGVNDPRCPVEESRQFRDKLLKLGKKEGVDFEYVEFGDEGHGAYTDISMRTRTLRLIIDFFNRKLK